MEAHRAPNALLSQQDYVVYSVLYLLSLLENTTLEMIKCLTLMMFEPFVFLKIVYVWLAKFVLLKLSFCFSILRNLDHNLDQL